MVPGEGFEPPTFGLQNRHPEFFWGFRPLDEHY